MLGIFTAHRDWVPAAARPAGHLQAVQVRWGARMAVSAQRCCLHGCCCSGRHNWHAKGCRPYTVHQSATGMLSHSATTPQNKPAGLQEALAIIVDAMQAYFTPVRFYSRQAGSGAMQVVPIACCAHGPLSCCTGGAPAEKPMPPAPRCPTAQLIRRYYPYFGYRAAMVHIALERTRQVRAAC